jgi:hypothetical protein
VESGAVAVLRRPPWALTEAAARSSIAPWPCLLIP